MGETIAKGLELLAAVAATAGVLLIFVGAYFGGFGLQSFYAVIGGIVLFAVGVVYLLQRDSAFSAKLSSLLKDLFFST